MGAIGAVEDGAGGSRRGKKWAFIHVAFAICQCARQSKRTRKGEEHDAGRTPIDRQSGWHD